MNETWYLSESPGREYVYKDMMNHFKLTENSKLNKKNFVHAFMNIGYLSLLVKEKLAEEYDKYGSFGSYRGYTTFARKTIIENVLNELEDREKKMALVYFQNSSLLSNYINHYLFKPNSKRVKNLKKEFDSLKNDT